MHALINQLDQEGFWNRMRVDSEGRATAVLFALPDSLIYLQAYSGLLLLDCTYKTNRYGMPLLDIIGVDACQKTFCIAFAFLSGQEEQGYLWALERLKSLYEICNTSFPSVIITDCALACINAVAICFPSAVLLLCLWHANKAVLAYCRPAFIQHRTDPKTTEAELLNWQEFYNQWRLIIQSADQVTFDRRVQQLAQRYLPAYANEIGYLHATWLNPHKEKLVKAWVDQHLHFGTIVTSRVEGIHSLLKSYLNTSTLDLFEAWGAITRAVTNQVHQLQSNQAQQQLRQPIELRIALYSAVQGWVSFEALRKVEEQRKRLWDKTSLFLAALAFLCEHWDYLAFTYFKPYKNKAKFFFLRISISISISSAQGSNSYSLSLVLA